jgi:glycolate oxidase FAD binding subunit
MKINSQIFQDSNNTYYPKDEEEVSILIKEFYKNNLPTEIVGTNTKSFIGNKTQASNKISLSKLSGIIDYFPEELYIKVKAWYSIRGRRKSL